MSTDDLRSAPVPALTESDHVRGPDDAPLVVFYGDFTCPRCVVAWQRLDGARARVCFRHFALKAKHPRAVALALAVEAAGLQGAFWEMADALYADPARTDDPHLWARCEALGLDLDRFEADRRSDAVAERVREQVRGGLAAGITMTPTILAPEPIRSLVPEWTSSDTDREASRAHRPKDERQKGNHT